MFHILLIYYLIVLQIKQHFRDGYLHKNEFKIVYVAPMKVETF